MNFTAIDLQYKNKNVIKLDQPETRKIVLNGVYKYTSNLYSCLQTSDTTFDVIIQCKKGRVKITFTNFTLDSYNTSDSKPSVFFGSSLEELIQSKIQNYGKPCKERVSEYTVEMQTQCNLVLEAFRKFAGSLKVQEKDDW